MLTKARTTYNIMHLYKLQNTYNILFKVDSLGNKMLSIF